jgi:hypothetical protein
VLARGGRPARLIGCPLSPLIIIEVKAEHKMPQIRLQKITSKPLRLSTSRENSQDRVSKALEISIFMSTTGHFLQWKKRVVFSTNLKFSWMLLF